MTLAYIKEETHAAVVAENERLREQLEAAERTLRIIIRARQYYGAPASQAESYFTDKALRWNYDPPIANDREAAMRHIWGALFSEVQLPEPPQPDAGARGEG